MLTQFKFLNIYLVQHSSFTFSATDKGDKIVFAARSVMMVQIQILKHLQIGTGISEVVDDTSPQLGGDLDSFNNC